MLVPPPLPALVSEPDPEPEPEPESDLAGVEDAAEVSAVFAPESLPPSDLAESVFTESPPVAALPLLPASPDFSAGFEPLFLKFLECFLAATGAGGKTGITDFLQEFLLEPAITATIFVNRHGNLHRAGDYTGLV